MPEKWGNQSPRQTPQKRGKVEENIYAMWGKKLKRLQQQHAALFTVQRGKDLRTEQVVLKRDDELVSGSFQTVYSRRQLCYV
jgi:hypothetical protein